MSDDVLSQAEVESLLNGIDPDLSQPPAGMPEVPSSRAPTLRSRKKATPSDGKRPLRVSKEQLRALQVLHEPLGRGFGAAMSALLRTKMEVRLSSVDQLTYNEFVFSLDNPTCLNLLRPHPLEGHMVLDVNPSILFPIIDRLLGGGKNTGSPPQRPLTEIEWLLVARITTLFNQELEKAWASLLELEVTVERVESNPEIVQAMAPNDVVVLINFELSLGEHQGMMSLCIPFASIERMTSQETAKRWDGHARSGGTPESRETIAERLDGSRVDVVVTLAESSVSTADLIGLRVGDVITTEKGIHSPLRVDIQGVEKFAASPGTFKGKAAIQILDSIETRGRATSN